MMDHIYRNAVQVNVNPGTGDAASGVACKTLESFGKYCTGAMLLGPQQGFFRKNYENLGDDVLSEERSMCFYGSY